MPGAQFGSGALDSDAEIPGVPSMLVPPQLLQIADIPTHTQASWRRDDKGGGVVYSAPAIRTDSMLGMTPSPGAVDWLLQSTSFEYSAPSDRDDALVEGIFRRCRFNATCSMAACREALDAQASPIEAADRLESLLGLWTRRCWEDRHIKEAAEGVKWAHTPPARAFILSSWCRFSTTAKKAGQSSSSMTGGNAQLLENWRRCRAARSNPAEVAEEAGSRLRSPSPGCPSGASREDVWDAVEQCCGDARCLHRVMAMTDEHTAAMLQKHASGLLAGSMASRPRATRKSSAVE